MTPSRITRAGLLAVLLLPDLAAAAGLNDTGITQCANETQNNLSCPQADFPSQDAETGRDAQTDLTKVGGGAAGFDFTKLDAVGNPLPASATVWDCVRDNVTGLVWEIKTDDGGLRDKDWRYTWYNSDPATNGGNAGFLGLKQPYHPDYPTFSDTCGGTLPSNQCNTQAYAAAVNVLNPALCGYTDWRMPTIEELHSIVDLSRRDPAIDAAYFPRTVPDNSDYLYSHYWSASSQAFSRTGAWSVGFDLGSIGTTYKGGAGNYILRGLCVRLVHGGSPYTPETTPTHDFTLDDVNGTAYHQKTGLTWKRCAEGQIWDSVNKTCTGTATRYTWSAALSLASGGWRLPSIKELNSIVEKHNYNPAINATVFPNTSSSSLYAVWSASPFSIYSRARYVDFYHGYNNYGYMQLSYAVRLVRGGQYGLPGGLALAGLASNGSIWYTPNLSTWTQIPGVLSQLQVGDFNGDGQTDLAGVASNGSLWYTPNLSTWTQIPGALSRLDVGDFNGDGQADLAGLASNGTIWYTTDLNTWTRIPGALSQLVAGDFNGDGQADLAGLASNGTIWYTTNLSTWNNIPGALSQLVAGDLNGDGHADLAGLAGNGTIWYTTSLGVSWTHISGALSQLVAGDFNGDGHADLAGLASNGSLWYTINLNTWTQIPGQLSQLRTADLNGDGHADLAGLASNGSIWYTVNLSAWTNIPGQLAQLAGD